MPAENLKHIPPNQTLLTCVFSPFSLSEYLELACKVYHYSELQRGVKLYKLLLQIWINWRSYTGRTSFSSMAVSSSKDDQASSSSSSLEVPVKLEVEVVGGSVSNGRGVELDADNESSVLTSPTNGNNGSPVPIELEEEVVGGGMINVNGRGGESGISGCSLVAPPSNGNNGPSAPLNLEKETVDGSISNVTSQDGEFVSTGGDSSTFAQPSSGGGDSSGTNFPRPNTLPPREALSTNKSDQHLSNIKFEKSKTERQRNKKRMPDEALQIFDDKIPVQQKLKILNRIATVKDDGTVEFEVPRDVDARALELGTDNVCSAVEDEPLDDAELSYIPPLQIVMLIVGTRGDVQPFIAIGKRLQDFGHRVRLATHSNFKEFVLNSGLEFYPLGGDPKILAGYMVKNKGFLPSGPSEIPVQRNQLKEIIGSLLPACKEPDIDSGIAFKADAIIANPPAYGHTHVAEALKVPIHIFFTMPWTPTSEFPHPLSRVKQPAGYRLSYQIVDSLIWLGIRDMINETRKKKLKLRPVTYLSGSQGSESDIPHGYIWSPHLVPKPKDWGPKVDVVGFCFLDLASNYQPPEPLLDWLKAGPKPIYIGFGSLPVQEPEKMTQIIVKALEMTGQRGIINKGWGGLGNLAESKDSIYLLDNVPHDWLFLQCAAVVHHGGAGTTAAGLKAACPTTIVPFFGDQPFWGERVHARGVGPAPIPIDEFSLPKLVDAIKYMLDPKVKERAMELAKAMEFEDGVTGAVKAFLRHLPRKKLEPEIVSVPSSLFSFRRCFGCS